MKFTGTKIKNDPQKGIAEHPAQGIDQPAEEYLFAISDLFADVCSCRNIGGKGAGTNGSHQSQDKCRKKWELNGINQ